jgi:hypothetical protein
MMDNEMISSIAYEAHYDNGSGFDLDFERIFAKKLLDRCIAICEEIAEDVDNGNVFLRDQKRLDAYNNYFGTGPIECADKIRKEFGL